ncbi:MAG: leucine-rich repeat domain-containing protein, partial [Clostridia bacterium]|nr:leucine-rich repeat domain-containing protein [Clostridia bacterium]
SIGDYNFAGCTSLTSISVGENNLKYMSIDGNLYSKDGKTLIKYAAGKKYATFEIPEGVTTIGYTAFEDCQYISTVIIPDSVTIIENYAFYGCVRLEYNVYENGNYLGNESNPYMVLVDVISTEVTSFTINENCKIISPRAFTKCENLTSIVIPDSVISIGEYAFFCCTSLRSITMGKNVTFIGGFAFDGCTGITDIVIPDGVTSIGDLTFAGCTNLKNVTLGKGIITIGYLAFSDCTSLESIVIPDTVTEIDDLVFEGCTNLTDVYFAGTEEQWNAISIGLYNEFLFNATMHFEYVQDVE